MSVFTADLFHPLLPPCQEMWGVQGGHKLFKIWAGEMVKWWRAFAAYTRPKFGDKDLALNGSPPEVQL